METGLGQGEARPWGVPTTLSVPRDGFLSRGTRMSSSWPSCSTAGACEERREGKGLPADHTAEEQARPRPVPTRGHQGLAGTLHPGALAGPWGECGRPAVHQGWELAPPRGRASSSPAQRPHPRPSRACPHSPSSGAARASTRSRGRSVGEEVLARLTGHWVRPASGQVRAGRAGRAPEARRHL